MTQDLTTCVRCGRPGERLAAPPLPNALGQRIFESICQVCWKEWLKQQTAVINHYGLDVRDPKARQLLLGHTETYFFGAQAR